MPRYKELQNNNYKIKQPAYLLNQDWVKFTQSFGSSCQLDVFLHTV
jgi:hypothetical protein